MKVFGFDVSTIAEWVTILTPLWAGLFWIVMHKRFSMAWRKWRKLILSAGAFLFIGGLWSKGWLAWLGTTIQVPVWLLIPACATVLACAALLLYSQWIKHKRPTYEDYTHDMIEGVEWRWNYPNGVLDSYPFNAFCPDSKCMSRLTYEVMRIPASHAYSTSYTCPCCGSKKTLKGTHTDIKDRISIEVERRINTGQYVDRIHELRSR